MDFSRFRAMPASAIRPKFNIRRPTVQNLIDYYVDMLQRQKAFDPKPEDVRKLKRVITTLTALKGFKFNRFVTPTSPGRLGHLHIHETDSSSSPVVGNWYLPSHTLKGVGNYGKVLKNATSEDIKLALHAEREKLIINLKQTDR